MTQMRALCRPSVLLVFVVFAEFLPDRGWAICLNEGQHRTRFHSMVNVPATLGKYGTLSIGQRGTCSKKT